MAQTIKLKQPKTKPKKTGRDLAFLMTVGVLFGWSLFTGILTTTVFSQNYLSSLIGMALITGLFAFIFSHKSMLIAAGALFLAGIGFIVYGFTLAPEISLAHDAAIYVQETLEFMVGLRAYRESYAAPVLWGLKAIIGAVVALWLYVRFRFYPVFILGAAIFAVAVTSPFFEYSQTLNVLIFSLIVLLCRHLNQQKISKGAAKPPFANYLVGIAAVSFTLAGFLPTPNNLFEEGFTGTGSRTPMEFFSDLFDRLFRDGQIPGEFSLQTIGFGGNGLLGGDIALNNDVFMRVRLDSGQASEPMYLTGRVLDTYTGSRWESLFEDPQPLDDNPNIFQSLELIEPSMMFELVNLLDMADSLRNGETRMATPAEIERIYARWEADFWEFNNAEDFEDTELMFTPPEQSNNIYLVNSETGELVHTLWNAGDNFISYMPLDANIWWSEPQNLTIDTLNSRTASAFHTGLPISIRSSRLSDDMPDFLRSVERNFVAMERLPSNSLYTVRYHNLERSNWWSIMGEEDRVGDFINRMLERSEAGLFDEVGEIISEFPQLVGVDPFSNTRFQFGQDLRFTYAELFTDFLSPRASEIRERYLALPDGFPDRVRELAEEVTAAGTNDYERMRLLETYLSTNFPYTTSPGASPRNQDFVDHFLFELQQGYCVHFATAFVTMARSLGMPTRYVEGFLVSGPRGEGNFVDVLNNMAHAWPEVYFEGVGWQRFEPTPAGGLPHNYFAPVAAEEVQRPVTENTNTGGDFFEEDWTLQMTPEEREAFERQQSGNQEGTSTTSNAPGAAAVETQEPAEVDWQHVLTLAASAVAVVVVVTVTLRTFKKWIRQKHSHRYAVLQKFDVLLAYLKVFNLKMEDQETVQQFLERGCQSFIMVGADKQLLMEAGTVYAKARYSKLKITAADRRVLDKTIKTLKGRMKYKLGYPKYLFYRSLFACMGR